MALPHRADHDRQHIARRRTANNRCGPGSHADRPRSATAFGPGTATPSAANRIRLARIVSAEYCPAVDLALPQSSDRWVHARAVLARDRPGATLPGTVVLSLRFAERLWRREPRPTSATAGSANAGSTMAMHGVTRTLTVLGVGERVAADRHDQVEIACLRLGVHDGQAR